MPLHLHPSSSDFPVLCSACPPPRSHSITLSNSQPVGKLVYYASYCPSPPAHRLHQEDFPFLFVYLQVPRTIFDTLFSAFQKLWSIEFRSLICALFLLTGDSFLQGLIYVEDYGGCPFPSKVLLGRTWSNFITRFWRELASSHSPRLLYGVRTLASILPSDPVKYWYSTKTKKNNTPRRKRDGGVGVFPKIKFPHAAKETT